MWDDRFLGAEVARIEMSVALDTETSSEEVDSHLAALRKTLATDADALGVPYAPPVVRQELAVAFINGAPTKVIAIQGYVEVAVRGTV